MSIRKTTVSKILSSGKITVVTILLLIIIVIMSILSVVLSPDISFQEEETVTTTVIKTTAASSMSEAASQTLTQPSYNTPTFRDNLSAPYAGLYEANNFTAIYEKQAMSTIHPASLAKVLTAITALSYVPSDTVFTVGSEQDLVPARSSLCLIKEGHQLTLHQLITGMLVASGNDAAYTIAVNTARFVADADIESMNNSDALSYFSDLMNSTAKTAGVENSHFISPDGFDTEGQYTTIRDLSIICLYAMNFPEICEIVKCAEKHITFKSGENVTWKNSNQLLHRESPYYYPDAIGMKTGTSNLAGKCLIAVAEINGKVYIAIVAGCQSEESRYKSATDLFNLVASM